MLTITHYFHVKAIEEPFSKETFNGKSNLFLS